MGVVEIHPDKDVWMAGETVTGIVLVQFARRTQVSEVEALLYAVEFVEVKVTKGAGKSRHTVTYRETVPVLEQQLLSPSTGGPVLGPGMYEPGIYTVDFAAPLPPQAPPGCSLRAFHFMGELNYALRARLGVPWRFDPKALADIEVVTPARPAKRETTYGGAGPAFGTAGTSISMELSVSDVPRGGRIEGAATISSTAAPRLKGVRLGLAERVLGDAQGHSSGRSTLLGELEWPEGRVKLGEPFRFAFQVPESARPDYQGAILRVDHSVAVAGDLAWAVNPTAQTSVVVS